MRLSFIVLACLAATSVAMLGCGDAQQSAYRSDSVGSSSAAQLSVNEGELGFAREFESGPADGDSQADPAPVEASEFSRKLIYTAEADLIVEDFDPVAAAVERLVREHGGFIASSRLGSTRGTRRSGTWQARIPADRFEAFLTATAALGEVRSVSRKSQDVTDEFFDVEARVRNKQALETRLLKILTERDGELEDVLTVERELSRVREEIERMQGRLRLLSNLSALATVNLRVEEIQNYVPEQAPTFGRRISRSFEGSLTALRQTAEAVAVAVVAIAPWLIALAVIVLPLVWLARRCLRSCCGFRRSGD